MMMRKPTWIVSTLIAVGVFGILTAVWISPNIAMSKWNGTRSEVLQHLSTSTHPQSSNTPQPTTTVTLSPTQENRTPLPPTISGVVVDAKGPVAGAIVQIHGSPIQTKTSKSGVYILSGMSGTTPVVVTAWYAGYYIGSATVNPSAPEWKGGQDITITLKPYDTSDNNQYAWFSFNGVKGSASCGLCHREYPEWQADAHSQAAINPRFLSMYTGQDANGNVGQTIQYGTDGKALPHDPSKPFYGPGYQLDNPGRAGNCATCHTPMASRSLNTQNCSWSGCHTSLTIDRSKSVIPSPAYPVSLQGDAAEGISCDFCHKIGDIILDPKTQLPLPDMPGILSMQLFRPKEGQQIFFGTLVDVPRRDTYLPLLSESKYCAACHYGVFGGVVGVGTVTGGTLIYNSYGEWLDSPYSSPKTGKTCQDCHMPTSTANWFVFADQGGLQRDYTNLHNHTMPGATDQAFLQNAVTLKSTAKRYGNQILAEVHITNDNTGHDIPTDSPIRSMILVVQVTDENGNGLTQTAGPVNPSYSGNYAGTPGKTFAKVLKDEETGETPTGAYWRTISIVSDNRLAALATDKTNYTFSAPEGKTVTLRIRLLYRRAFQKLADQKGWNDPDILMKEQTITITAKP